MAIFGKYMSYDYEVGKEIFETYLQTGTWKKTQAALNKQGKMLKHGQKPFSTLTIRIYGWKFAIYNMKEAYQMVLKSGMNITWEFWEQFVVKTAYHMLKNRSKQPDAFLEWLRSNDLYDKYKDYKASIGMTYVVED